MTHSASAKTSPAKVLIVDDHPAVREGLAMRIDRQPDMKVCGEAADVPEALHFVAETQPDVAIIDIALKNGNGIDLIKRIKTHNESLRMLVCSMYGETLYADRALRAGAMGYITKEHATDKIIEAIRRVLEGKIYLSDEMAEKLLHRAVGQGATRLARSPLEKLSDRELEVFQLIGQGVDTHQIAERMRVSAKTVETYRARIKEKLRIGNRIELVQRAVQWVMEQA